MTRLRSCARCGGVHDVRTRCPHKVLHDQRASGWSGRDTAAHNRWARAVKARDGRQCMFILPTGLRCPATEPLVAHHLVPGSERLEDGITLCRDHHRVVDSHAR